jgi:hypothetical protein
MQRRFTATHPDVFAMTLLAESLRSDHPRSPRAAYLLLAPDIQAWALPDYCLRTEEPAFDQAYGKGAWEFFAEHPSGDARFDVSRQAVIRQEVRALIPAYDQGFSGTIVDVRGLPAKAHHVQQGGSGTHARDIHQEPAHHGSPACLTPAGDAKGGPASSKKEELWRK